jgi:hypothetical protein
MALFKNPTHQDIWLENWCYRCFQPDEVMWRIQGKGRMCPILTGALSTGRKPKEWDRMPRADTMAKSIRCNAFLSRPELTKKQTIPDPQQQAMFDVEPHEISYVPVEGWPDKPSPKEVDHQ